MDATNYLRISIKKAFSINFERIPHQQIMNHVKKFEHTKSLQFGFQKGVSIVYALLFFEELVLKSTHTILLNLHFWNS